MSRVAAKAACLVGETLGVTYPLQVKTKLRIEETINAVITSKGRLSLGADVQQGYHHVQLAAVLRGSDPKYRLAAAYLLLLGKSEAARALFRLRSVPSFCAHTKLTIAPEFALQQFHAAGGGLQFTQASSRGWPFKRGINYMRKFLLVSIAAATLAVAGGAAAAEVEVKLLNKGAEGVMVFEPSFVKIAPGDTVKFLAADKGHNAETVKGMLPDGAAPFVGKMGEDVSIKFDQPGVYGIKCLPHYGMGMVAMVVVGTPTNEDQAKAVPQVGKAKQAFAALFDKLAANRTAAK